MKDFKEWLSRQHAAATVKQYDWEVGRFGGRKDASGSEILAYLDRFRKQGRSPSYISSILAALKAWHHFLQATKQREDHPCRYIRLRDRKAYSLPVHRLLTAEELESLTDRKERFPLLARRNLAMIQLMIYQGLTSQDLTKLRSQDIDLNNATVTISATAKTNPRTLALKAQQILPLAQYINIDRPQLNPEHLAQLFITSRKTAWNPEDIASLCVQYKKRFPGRKVTPVTIRMSAIARWLAEGTDLRKVQYMAGHKKPSSTERYKQSDTAALAKWIDQVHPLQ